MAFGIGINHSQTEAGPLCRKQQRVAVACWFTSQGRAMPLWMKYQDSTGRCHRIDDIFVMQEDEKHYAGILTREYRCRAELEGLQIQFTLCFFPETCEWKLVQETERGKQDDICE